MKKLKKIIVVLLGIFLICFIGLFGIDFYVIGTTSNKIVEIDEIKNDDEIDCILILGAGLRGNKPSPMLSERLDKGIEAYEALDKKIIMSGDHAHDNHDEVNAMKQYAINEGVISQDIFMDHAGLSTYDSVYRAKEIFGAKKIVIVTQKYHLYRALYIADSLGVEAIGLDATKVTYKNQVYREIREILARVKDFGKSIIKPESEFLGEEIPVWGDGNITNDKEYITIKNLKDNGEMYISNKEKLNIIKEIMNSNKFKKIEEKLAINYKIIISDDTVYDIAIKDNIVHIIKDKKEIKLSEEESIILIENYFMDN